MAFIKVQNKVMNDEGVIIGGSASIVNVTYRYTGEKNHSKQTVLESLGQVVYMAEKRSGVFLSKTRGLVEYNVDTGVFKPVETTDPRVAGHPVPANPSTHAVFGDAFALMELLSQSHFLGVLKEATGDVLLYQRTLARLFHDLARDGSHISCEDFFAKSVMSHLLNWTPTASLRSDTNYLFTMGENEVKTAFFQRFVAQMRQENPTFGIGCYVDSMPLPRDLQDTVVNAFHHPMRLALVLDETTGLPIWYDLVPESAAKGSAIPGVLEQVSHLLDVSVRTLVVDASYVNDTLMEKGHVGIPSRVIAHMPQRQGYPYRQLFEDHLSQIQDVANDIRTGGRDYFGAKCPVSLFGQNLFAYVYVDRTQALRTLGDYKDQTPDEYDALTVEEKRWHAYRGGYFVLLSNQNATPLAILEDYRRVAALESSFKTLDTSLVRVPAKMWAEQTLRGLLLFNIISAIARLQLRSLLDRHRLNLSDFWGKTQSLMCAVGKEEQLIIDAPNRQVQVLYQALNLVLPHPATVSLLQARYQLSA